MESKDNRAELLLYQQLYAEENEKFSKRPAAQYCKFPLSETYSEENMKNMQRWRKGLSSLSRGIAGVHFGFDKVVYYYKFLDYELGRQYAESLLEALKSPYDYSEENYKLMLKWDDNNRGRHVKLGFSKNGNGIIELNPCYGRGIFPETEEGILASLRHGGGDEFGF